MAKLKASKATYDQHPSPSSKSTTRHPKLASSYSFVASFSKKIITASFSPLRFGFVCTFLNCFIFTSFLAAKGSRSQISLVTFLESVLTLWRPSTNLFTLVVKLSFLGPLSSSIKTPPFCVALALTTFYPKAFGFTSLELRCRTSSCWSLSAQGKSSYCSSRV